MVALKGNLKWSHMRLITIPIAREYFMFSVREKKDFPSNFKNE